MEENKEKKQIKMSLGTFTVLLVAILIFGVAGALGFQKANGKFNMPQQSTGNEQLQNTQVVGNDQQNKFFVLYKGEEINRYPGIQLLNDGMKINNENLKKYNTTYYNFENGEYVGTTKGVFGTEETGTVEGFSIVGNVKTLALSHNYNATLRTYTSINELPDALMDMADCSSVEIQEIDLDNDGNKEHILCWTVDYSAEDFDDNQPVASSGIELYDSNYNKIATLVKLDNGFWANLKDRKIFLSLDKVTYADIDIDGIMEILIEIPTYENYSLGIYKYKNGSLSGETNYSASVQP